MCPVYPGAHLHSPVSGTHAPLLRQPQRLEQWGPYQPLGQAENTQIFESCLVYQRDYCKFLILKVLFQY